MSKRFFVVGDIHGHYHTLKALIRKIGVRKGDTILFLGDYIDRGPSSKRVIRFILALERWGVETICLMGNHESMFIDYLRKERGIEVFPVDHEMLSYVTTGELYCHRANCGFATIAEYEKVESVLSDRIRSPEDTDEFRIIFRVPESHLKFLRGLKPYHLEEQSGHKLLFVHAGMPPEALKQSSLEKALSVSMEESLIRGSSALLWQRESFHVPVRFGMLIVHGHWPMGSVLSFYREHPDYLPDGFLEALASAEKTPRVIQGKLNLDYGIASFSGKGAICAVEFINGVPQEGVLCYDIDE
jgi:hypothetical protein